MRKKHVLICSLLLALAFTQCQTIGIRQHFERDLSQNEQKKVIRTNEKDSLKDIRNDGKVYAITGVQLRDMLQGSSRALVYQWNPVCKSKTCFPLSSLQDYCSNHNIELYVVADFYFGIFTQNTSLVDHPVFIANDEAYGTDRCEKLFVMFYKDLLGKELYERHIDELWFRYMYFEDGHLSTLSRNPFKNQ